MIGEEIIRMVKSLQADGISFVSSSSKKGELFTYACNHYLIDLTVGKKWLGLNFKYLSPRIDYWVDTDLYDISKDEYKELAQDIEESIVNFLQQLRDQEIKLSQSPRPTLLIPTKVGFILMTHGGKQTVSSLDMIDEGYTFTPIPRA